MAGQKENRGVRGGAQDEAGQLAGAIYAGAYINGARHRAPSCAARVRRPSRTHTTLGWGHTLEGHSS